MGNTSLYDQLDPSQSCVVCAHKDAKGLRQELVMLTQGRSSLNIQT